LSIVIYEEIREDHADGNLIKKKNSPLFKRNKTKKDEALLLEKRKIL
jgi:hypothetical protein